MVHALLVLVVVSIHILVLHRHGFLLLSIPMHKYQIGSKNVQYNYY